MAYETIIMSLLAIAPISELRGAMLYGLGVGLNKYLVFFLSTVLNILIVPAIFYVLSKARFLTLAKQLFGKRAYEKIDKSKPWFDKYGVWALLPFVAVPLPVTGAWTGAFIAVLLNMNRKKALIAISLGVIVAGLLVFGGITSVVGIWKIIR